MPDLPNLPNCGLYLTRVAIGSVPAGRLVYFHNHGDPGPGVYLPSRWVGNEARFEQPGQLLGDVDANAALEPRQAEGVYRVSVAFDCCANHCRTFDVDALVQLGYDGAGNAILFEPTYADGRVVFPERGSRVDLDRLPKLALLRVARPQHRPEGGAETVH